MLSRWVAERSAKCLEAEGRWGVLRTMDFPALVRGLIARRIIARDAGALVAFSSAVRARWEAEHLPCVGALCSAFSSAAGEQRMHTCRNVSVTLRTVLSACRSACLPVALSVCLCVCLPVCLSVCLSVCLPVCLPVCLSVCTVLYCLSVCLLRCMSARISESEKTAGYASAEAHRADSAAAAARFDVTAVVAAEAHEALSKNMHFVPGGRAMVRDAETTEDGIAALGNAHVAHSEAGDRAPRTVCLSVGLSVCLSVCLSVGMSVCLSVCMPACLSVVYVCLVCRLSLCAQPLRRTPRGHSEWP